MTEEQLKQRITELEVAAKEGLRTIEWFEEWLNRRDEPVRYDPVGLSKHPIEFTVNYEHKTVEEIRTFIKAVIDDVPESKA